VHTKAAHEYESSCDVSQQINLRPFHSAARSFANNFRRKSLLAVISVGIFFSQEAVPHALRITKCDEIASSITVKIAIKSLW
jgi:hypothetical protein